jgi:hypothetical protein
MCGVPALVWGQSLGDAARKERERREKNKAEGVAAREFSEVEIFGEEKEEEAEEPAAEADEGESTDSDPPRRPSMPSVDLDSITSESGPSDAGRRDRSREEAEWRSRFQQAKQRIEDAREQVRFLQDLNLMPGGSYVDARGRTVIQSLEHLRALVQAAETKLLDAEQSLSALQEEARRAGVPPGWTR